MNKVVLIGRMVKDAEVRYMTTNDNKAVANFTVAVDRAGKDKGTDFINCVAFGKLAEHISKWFPKGTPIAITDSAIRTGSYENKEGRKVFTTDVSVYSVEFVPRTKADNHSGQERQQERNIPDGFEMIDEMDVPF